VFPTHSELRPPLQIPGALGGCGRTVQDAINWDAPRLRGPRLRLLDAILVVAPTLRGDRQQRRRLHPDRLSDFLVGLAKEQRANELPVRCPPFPVPADKVSFGRGERLDACSSMTI
jgi:hypothetical protein